MKLANGYGSVYKLSGKRRKKWIVRLPYSEESRINGEKRKTLGYYSTKTEALNALMEYHKNPDIYLNRETTLKTVYNLWFPSHYKNMSEHTIKIYQRAFNRMESIQDMPINNIKLHHLQEIIDSMTVSCAEQAKILMGLLFNYAVLNDMCIKSYVKGVVVPKREPKIIRTPYTREEIKKLWEHSENLYARYSLIQIYTGMRLGEVIQMKKDNVHIDERYMIGGSKTKAGKNRIIPISKRILPVVKDLVEKCTSDRLMNDYRGEPTIIKLGEKFRENIGLPRHTSHDCRYTFAGLMEEKGVPLLTTQKIMGHSARNITQDLYTKQNIQSLIKAVDKLE